MTRRTASVRPSPLLALAGLAAALTGTPAPAPRTAQGAVFMVNPVQSSGNQDLTDQKDSDAAVPASAYRTVTLTNLDGPVACVGD